MEAAFLVNDYQEPNMKMKTLLSTFLLALPAMAALPVQAAQPGATEQQQAKPPIYGRQLMTPDERREYHQKMRNLKTKEERQAFRQEHHQQMQARAKEKGVTLPDAPPPRGGGRGMGPQNGMGPGQGMGPGAGNRPAP